MHIHGLQMRFPSRPNDSLSLDLTADGDALQLHFETVRSINCFGGRSIILQAEQVLFLL